MTEATSSSSRTRELKPLGITCTSSGCEQGLHCFRQTRKMRREGAKGLCRDCGTSLGDWQRIERLDLADVDYTFAALQRELIRHHFWHKTIDQHALNHARRKGRAGMRIAALRRVRSSVAAPSHPREGRQTPFEGNVLYYAQHAVAACCRACVEEWYGIPVDRGLTEAEIQFLTELVSRYVDLRMPDLSETGERIPPIRSRAPAPRPSGA